MIAPSDADEQLFGTLIAAARLGRADPIIDRLRARYDEEWDDPLAGFPYALALLALPLSGRAEYLERFNYTEIVETLGDVLFHRPDHWLARYLRIHTRTLLPDSGDHPHYLAAERTRAAEDAQELLSLQGRAAWQPWFSCGYLVAARVAWNSDRSDPERAAKLVLAAAGRPLAPVRFASLGSVMLDAFRWYQGQPELPEHGAVGVMMAALFPGSRAAWRERAGEAR